MINKLEITQEFVNSLFNELRIAILDRNSDLVKRYHAITNKLNGCELTIRGSFGLDGYSATYTVRGNLSGQGNVDILTISTRSNKEHVEIRRATAIYPLAAYEGGSLNLDVWDVDIINNLQKW